MVTYEQADFEQVANAIGVDVGQVAKHENLFEAAALTKHRENIIQAIKDGVPAAEVKDDLARIAMRREELQSQITPPRPKTESHRRKRANRESNRRTKRHPQCQIAIPQQRQRPGAMGTTAGPLVLTRLAATAGGWRRRVTAAPTMAFKQMPANSTVMG